MNSRKLASASWSLLALASIQGAAQGHHVIFHVKGPPPESWTVPDYEANVLCIYIYIYIRVYIYILYVYTFCWCLHKHFQFHMLVNFWWDFDLEFLRSWPQPCLLLPLISLQLVWHLVSFWADMFLSALQWHGWMMTAVAVFSRYKLQDTIGIYTIL